MNRDLNIIISLITSLLFLGLVGKPLMLQSKLTKTEIKYINRVQELENSYGRWQVHRAESVCPKHDLECIEREASRLAALLRTRYA